MNSNPYALDWATYEDETALACCDAEPADGVRLHPTAPVTENQLLGTWRNVEQQLDKPPGIPANQIFIRRARNELCFYSERGLAFLDLLPRGDSVGLMQGCFRYKHAVSFQKARPGSQDTLFVEGFGKYIRVDTATFFTAWRARTAAIIERQRVFDLQHAQVGEVQPVAEGQEYARWHP